uniref:Uncharacterized protein n=1 Tax=Salix viminalis TaxID=40686 RepID=A0A6N2MHE2_SALVM
MHHKRSWTVVASIAQDESIFNNGGANKLHSFGRWMDKEIGGGCHDSLMAHDSGNYWNTLGAENEAKEDSSLSPHIWVC